jgi:isopentenyl phosphate kinase
VGVHPLSAWCAENGELVSPDLTQVGCMLSLGLVPVLHGDVVMDRVRGGAIVSGDQLVRKCALGLSIRRVGLATDVPGVLCEGKVLPVVTPQIGEAVAGDSGHEDVTGGMRRKIAELLALAGEGISAEIFHISRLGDFLEGSPHGGTTVRSIE